MRITGGRARGIPLRSPKGQATRPAADAIRESLFSSLGDRVKGSSLLDMFAGTGAYGLESLSRGAAKVQFVEADARCIACIQENLKQVTKSCELDASVGRVSRADAFKWKGDSVGQWDILIADPPYADIPSVGQQLFVLADYWLSPDGLFVLEKPAGLNIETEGWIEIKRLGKKRGNGPSLSIWKRG